MGIEANKQKRSEKQKKKPERGIYQVEKMTGVGWGRKYQQTDENPQLCRLI